MDSVLKSFNQLIGVEVKDLTLVQLILRTVCCYLFTIAIVRMGHKRFMGRSTAFDVILGIILGSVVSRAINGQAPFLLTLVSGALLVFMHWTFAFFAFRSPGFAKLIKGETHELIRNGKFNEKELERNRITKEDVLGALRTNANLDSPNTIKCAILENSGHISAVPEERRVHPQVFEIKVEAGVQTIRLLV